MKLYTYNENTTFKGQVWSPKERHGEDESSAEDNGDISLYGEGTEQDLIDKALASLATRYDHRAGGSGDSFRWRTDRNVLKFIGGPAVEYDEAKQVWLPAVAADCDDES